MRRILKGAKKQGPRCGTAPGKTSEDSGGTTTTSEAGQSPPLRRVRATSLQSKPPGRMYSRVTHSFRVQRTARRVRFALKLEPPLRRT